MRHETSTSGMKKPADFFVSCSFTFLSEWTVFLPNRILLKASKQDNKGKTELYVAVKLRVEELFGYCGYTVKQKENF